MKEYPLQERSPLPNRSSARCTIFSPSHESYSKSRGSEDRRITYERAKHRLKHEVQHVVVGLGRWCFPSGDFGLLMRTLKWGFIMSALAFSPTWARQVSPAQKEPFCLPQR